ncbi:MAG TPA: ABC transporter permease [Candidatus Saccharimonadales bacterium]|nr:ABC transporter permease [Candidatus Saccharimonadales bacterium]
MSLWWKRKKESELNEEVRSHLQMSAQEHFARGEDKENANRAAWREFGGVELVKETTRDVWGWRWLEDFAEDLRFGFRMLRKSPGFTAVAVFSLALGIGANTAIFTLINDLMLKSLPVNQPEQLVSFGQSYGGGIIDGIGPGPLDIFTYEFYKRIENQHDAFQGVCAFGSFTRTVSVRTGGNSTGPVQQAVAHLVSGNFFTVLGANPVLGRSIEPADAIAPGQNPVAVISHKYWRQAFAADPSVVGRNIVVNGTSVNIVGVAPAKFYGVTLDEQPPDMWLPITMQEQVLLQPSLLTPQSPYWIHILGRRNPQTSVQQAQEWTNLQLQQAMEDREGSALTPQRKQEIEKVFVPLLPGGAGISDLRVQYSDSLKILMGIVALVLLIACANLANFLLAKTASREREISTRLALGAGRWRIVRQMLTETLLLALLGGTLGLLFATWGTHFLIDFVVRGATNTPFEANPDIHVLLFTASISLLTGILFGLAPSLRVSRTNVAPGLKANSRTVTGAGTSVGRLLPKLLVTAQVALSVVLLVSAGLFVRTLHNLENQDFGFDRQSVLLVQFDPKIAGYKSAQLDALENRIQAKLKALPGIRSSAFSGAPPISGGSWNSPITVMDSSSQAEKGSGTSLNRVTSSYFETVGIPLLQGRAVNEQDTAASSLVIVVNQAFANYFFPNGDALGHHITVGEPSVKGSWEIVGVAGNTKSGNPREAAPRILYFPARQLTDDGRFNYCLQVRAAGNPANIADQVRQALAQVDENLAIEKIQTVSEHLKHFTDQESMVSQLSGSFSILALLLACIGLYGVMTYNVVRRTNEIGIRMALGAQVDGVLWMVLKESLVLLAVGIGIGVPVTLAATRLIKTQLFGLSATDPLTLAGAVVAIAVVTLVAAYLPARRAGRVDPMVALRYE